nr:substrate-binding domain-containing protein [Chloroflexota bacterium]
MKPRLSAGLLVPALLLAACTSGPPTPPAASGGDQVVRLYTSVTQATVDAVVGGFGAQAAGTEVEVFRAPTGELAARIAAEQREGGLRADVLWLTDPLSMAEYDSQGLLAAWQPTEAEGIPAEYRSERY